MIAVTDHSQELLQPHSKLFKILNSISKSSHSWNILLHSVYSNTVMHDVSLSHRSRHFRSFKSADCMWCTDSSLAVQVISCMSAAIQRHHNEGDSFPARELWSLYLVNWEL